MTITEQRLREIASYDRRVRDGGAEKIQIAAELLAARSELAAINETLAGIEAALIDAGIGPIGNLGKRVGDLAYIEQRHRRERDAARADAESARREGQEISAGLHEKLHELRAENERLAKQRDELLKAAEIACRQCREETDIDSLAAVVARINAAEQPKPAGGGA